VPLVAFIIGIYHDARSTERQIHIKQFFIPFILLPDDGPIRPKTCTS